MSISRFMRVDQTWNGENYTSRSFILYIPHVMLRKLKEGNLSAWGSEKCLQNYRPSHGKSQYIWYISCNKHQGLINLNAVFCHQPRCAHPRALLHSGKFPFGRTFCLSFWRRYLRIEYVTFKIHIINLKNESIIIRFCQIISWQAVTLSLSTKMTSIMMSST